MINLINRINMLFRTFSFSFLSLSFLFPFSLFLFLISFFSLSLFLILRLASFVRLPSPVSRLPSPVLSPCPSSHFSRFLSIRC